MSLTQPPISSCQVFERPKKCRGCLCLRQQYGGSSRREVLFGSIHTWSGIQFCFWDGPGYVSYDRDPTGPSVLRSPCMRCLGLEVHHPSPPSTDHRSERAEELQQSAVHRQQRESELYNAALMGCSENSDLSDSCWASIATTLSVLEPPWRCFKHMPPGRLVLAADSLHECGALLVRRKESASSQKKLADARIRQCRFCATPPQNLRTSLGLMAIWGSAKTPLANPNKRYSRNTSWPVLSYAQNLAVVNGKSLLSTTFTES